MAKRKRRTKAPKRPGKVDWKLRGKLVGATAFGVLIGQDPGATVFVAGVVALLIAWERYRALRWWMHSRERAKASAKRAPQPSGQVQQSQWNPGRPVYFDDRPN